MHNMYMKESDAVPFLLTISICCKKVLVLMKLNHTLSNG